MCTEALVLSFSLNQKIHQSWSDHFKNDLCWRFWLQSLESLRALALSWNFSDGAGQKNDDLDLIVFDWCIFLVLFEEVFELDVVMCKTPCNVNIALLVMKIVEFLMISSSMCILLEHVFSWVNMSSVFVYKLVIDLTTTQAEEFRSSYGNFLMCLMVTK